LAVIGNVLVIGFVTIAQRDLKQMVGYSSVMHMGYAFLGIAAGSTLGVGGVVLLMVAHGLSVALMFLLSTSVYHRTHTFALDEMGGLAQKAPVLAALFVAATFAGIGLPGFANFWGELTIFVALWKFSPLITALAGEPRVIVSEIAGTTRDSIDVRFEIDGHAFVAIDTAGVRKRKSWADDIEYYSHQRAKEAITRADVCVLLLDAREPISQIEKRLALALMEQHKPTVIAVNKWDLVEAKLKTSDYIDYLTQELFALDFAPLVFISAAQSEGVGELIRVCSNLFTQANHRETTGRLNAAIRSVLTERGPSSKLGTKAKIFYVSQIATQPPTIAVVVNKPELFEGQYEKYLVNQLREMLPFSEVPIKMVFSERKRLSPEELKSRRKAGVEVAEGDGEDAGYGD
jgi:small GTP-binding protein